MNLVFVTLVSLAIACPFAAVLKARGINIDDSAMQSMHAQAHSKKRAAAVEIEDTFVLTSRVKTQASAVFGQGFPVGFAVNGFETPELNLLADKTYNFTVLSGCNHPFYLSFDVRGRGRLPVPDGWIPTPPTAANAGNAICGGKSILWKPPKAYIGRDIYYHCFVHDNMGWRINVKAQSICDKYTDILRSAVITNSGLVTAIVQKTLAKVLAKDSKLLEYFNGEVPTGSTDFTSAANAKKTAKLTNDLIAFFGSALGCTDGSIPAYNGPSMKEVHAQMPIGADEYNQFVAAVSSVLKGFNVEPEDITAVEVLLNSAGVRGEICNVQGDCFESICNKYSTKKNGDIVTGANKILVRTVVDKIFTKVLAEPTLKPFFDSTTPVGSKNFLNDAGATETLKQNFVAFLGISDVLACTDPVFPVNGYKVSDLQATHIGMPITKQIFDKFNDLVVAALADLNVEANDQKAVRAILDLTEPLICNQPGCSTIQAAAGSQVYTVGLQPKVAGNHYYQRGNPNFFTIDGKEQEGLNLQVGQEYVFRSNVTCFHPFYLSTGTGAGSPELLEEAGVSVGVGANTCLGKSLVFKPLASQVGSSLFYACRNHEFMGGRICVVNNAASAPPCLADNGQPLANDARTPCDDLTAAVQTKEPSIKSAGIIKQLVTDVFLNAAVNTPASYKKYFDGTYPPMYSTNFLPAGGDQDRLVTGLTKFFYTNLGCSDNSMTGYAPGEQPNMKTIHQNMHIPKEDFDGFNALIVAKLSSYGTYGVGMTPTNLKKASAFLNATSADICATCGDYFQPTLCEKWATGSQTYKGDQKKMVTDVVKGVFGKLTADAATKPFFDGTKPCESRDFVTDPINQLALVNTLTAFFGSSGVLGCTQPNFPQFRGNSDMDEVHKYMPITKSVFDSFNTALVDVIKGALMADVPTLPDDLAAVQALLSSPAISVICNRDDCTAPAGTYVKRTCANAPGGMETMTTAYSSASQFVVVAGSLLFALLALF